MFCANFCDSLACFSASSREISPLKVLKMSYASFTTCEKFLFDEFIQKINIDK